jgi:hypothetical protein
VRRIAFDATARTLELLGQAAAISAGVGAAAVRLSGVANEAQLVEAIREELKSLGIARETIERINRSDARYLLHCQRSKSCEPVCRPC